MSILPAPGIKHRTLHLLSTLLFLALFAFPLLPLKATNLILILFSFTTALLYILKPVPAGRTLFRNLIFVIPFIPYLAEFLISGLDPAARLGFEKKIFFFTAPLFVPLFLQITGFRNHRPALLVFAGALGLLALYSTLVLTFRGIPFNAASYADGAYLLRTHFENTSGLHPSYYSVFAIFSAFVLLLSARKTGRPLTFVLYGLAGLLGLTVLFLAVRIAFVIALVLILIHVTKLRFNAWVKGLISLSVLALLFIATLVVPSLRNRLNEFTLQQTDTPLSSNTIAQRSLILECSLDVFSGHLLWGTGDSNSQSELDACYESKGWPVNPERRYNPHNQFLSIGISYGLVDLLLFVVCLFLLFRKTFRRAEGLYFAIAVTLFFLSESILERQMGVYFFGLTGLLLYNTAGLQEPSITPSPQEITGT